MQVYDMVKAELESHDFDGLFNADSECGCDRTDIAPCGEMSGECVAAYRGKDGMYYDAHRAFRGCKKCGSNNVKCRGMITNCEDCGEVWETIERARLKSDSASVTGAQQAKV